MLKMLSTNTISFFVLAAHLETLIWNETILTLKWLVPDAK